jgi:AsmA protein
MRRRTAIPLIVIVLVVPFIVVAVFLARLNPNAYAPALQAAIERATGRQVTFGGPIRLRLSLAPSVEVSDISLDNPTGFKDAALLTVDKIQVKFLLLPLLSHRLNVTDLVMVHPTIVLERDSSGNADWALSGQARQTPGSASGPSTTTNAGAYQIAVQEVQVQDGVVTIRDGKTGGMAIINVTDLLGTATTLSSPLSLTAHALYKGIPISLTGIVGPVERFSGVGTGPWPVDLSLTTTGAAATIHGAIARPRTGQGYKLHVSASVPVLEAMMPLLPPGLFGVGNLPPIHNIDASADINDQNATIPAVDNLSIKTGASDLSAFRPGLLLQSADIEMPSLDKPLSFNAVGTINGQKLSLSAAAGAVQAFLPPDLLPADMPPQGGASVTIQMQDGAASLSVQGGIATPQKLAGAALSVNATIPALGDLAGLAGTALPDWRHIVLQTTLIDPGGMGLATATGLDSFATTMDGAAFGGDASLYFSSRPRLQAAIAFQHLNLDQVLDALPSAASNAPGPVAPAPPAATPPSANAPLIPSFTFPMALLKSADADLQLSADTMSFRQTVYNGIAAHANMANGLLTLNPVTGELPGGSISASGSLDASKEPAAATLTVNAPALALSPVLKAIGLPDTAQGTMQVRAQLTGTGDDPRDLANTLSGQIGLAMVNGIVDGSVIHRLIGSALEAVGLPASLTGSQGAVPIRCFGLRIDAANGVGSVKTLTLDSSRLLLEGGGTADFGPETLNLVLHPQLRLAGTPESVPVEVTGSFVNPQESVAPADAVNAAAGAATGLAKSLVSRLSGAGNLTGEAAPAPAPDVCPAALNLGRLGQPGPAAPPPDNATPVTGQAPAISGPKSLLNALFGK